MQVHRSIASLRTALTQTGRTGFVPTMGNLHAGHASLMRAARQQSDTVVASIFVNRTQFGPHEDFDAYPRTLDADCATLEQAGVDHLFAPDETVLYPSAQQYFVSPASAHDNLLEGALRPGHFRGVCTVVGKLFNIVQPDVALFGKKDYQQLMVIRNMVGELNFPIEIIGGEIIRAEDGLALSSRNGYLSSAERTEAPRLYQTLQQIAARIGAGGATLAELEAHACATLLAQGWQPDYVTIRRRSDLQTPQEGDALVVLAAAKLGKTRLIDNLEIS
jgi:pantoate--beta-alanine ligase